MSDIISVFNRLTEKRLADCILFETVLDEHYDKFKYFYFIISSIGMVDIDTITCRCEKTILLFTIKYTNKKDTHKYKELFQKHFEAFNHPYYNKYFDYVITYTDFEIEVRLSCTEGSEKNIYPSNYSGL